MKSLLAFALFFGWSRAQGFGSGIDCNDFSGWIVSVPSYIFCGISFTYTQFRRYVDQWSSNLTER